MKSILSILIVLFLLVSSVKAQVIVEETDINQLDIEYCQLLGYKKFLSNKVIVNIDYGQERKFLGKVQLVKGPNGKNMKFNSMIAALNFMEDNGWVYVNNYAITVSNQNVYHYLLRRVK